LNLSLKTSNSGLKTAQVFSSLYLAVNMGVYYNHFHSQLFVQPTYPTRSFAGETVIITGSNVGLGKEAARHIARLGASKLILAVRNVSAGEEAKKDIENTINCGGSVIEVWQLDLASYGK
jgi:hypothetical protein